MSQYNNLTELKNNQSTLSYRPIYAESTPFYIASRQACQRISESLPSSTKLIILLREPVSRAYSEYKMKQRRVNQQNSFLQLMQEYSHVITSCLLTNVQVDIKSKNDVFHEIKSCFPENISQHFHLKL